MTAGWYLMHRGWMASGDFKAEPFTDREAYLWSIEQAAFEPHVIWSKGVQIALQRGEFVTSVRDMAGALKWSEKRARGFAQRMSKAGKWTQRRAQGGAHAPTIVTVCNYALFQSPAKSKGTPEGTLGGSPGAHQGHTPGTQDNEGSNNGDEGKGKESASRAVVPSLPYSEAVAAWSEAAAVYGWTPGKPSLGDKRRGRLKKTLEKEGLAGWCDAIRRASQSALLTGPDPPGWFNFDFLIQHDNLLKVKDGNYDKPFGNSSGGSQRSPWLDARAELSGQDVHGAGAH